MNAETLLQIANSPAAFRNHLAFRDSTFGQSLADHQVQDFTALDAGFVSLKNGQTPTIGRFWIERTKGASKDSDLSTLLLWLLAFSHQPLVCQVGAADADQADELRRAAMGFVRANPWLELRLKVLANRIVNEQTGSYCEVIPADVGGSHGARPDLLILNELTHISKREFAETALDNATKIPRGLVVIATNAGFIPSWQYDLRELARQSHRWYFSAFSQPAPWIDPHELEERQKATSANRFARLWEGQWVSDTGDALQASDIDAAIVHPVPMDQRDKDYGYAAGVDLSMTKDASAVVVVGRHRLTGKYRLASVSVWTPVNGERVSLEAVRQRLKELHRTFGLSRVSIDPFQGAHLHELLRKENVPSLLTPQSGKQLNEQASHLIHTFQERAIELFPHPDLIADVRALQLQEMPYGVRLVHPKKTGDGPGTPHGDAASALSIALLAAKLARPVQVSGSLPQGAPPRIPARLQRDSVSALLNSFFGHRFF